MVKFYKVIDKDTISKAPNPIHDKGQGVKISNPPEEMYRVLGFKELVDTPYPETEEGYYRTFEYVDGDVITKVWSEPIQCEGVSESE